MNSTRERRCAVENIHPFQPLAPNFEKLPVDKENNIPEKRYELIKRLAVGGI
jgi:hypothetical protein